MFHHLLPPGYKDIVKQWVIDDCPTFDVGGFVVGEKTETALLYCKSSAVLAGVPFADVIFEQLDLQCTWNFDEGSYIDVVRDGGRNQRVVAAKVTGKCRNILLAERTALNTLSRASGVATAARRAATVKTAQGWH
eukprot:gene6331-8557_t